MPTGKKMLYVLFMGLFEYHIQTPISVLMLEIFNQPKGKEADLQCYYKVLLISSNIIIVFTNYLLY